MLFIPALESLETGAYSCVFLETEMAAITQEIQGQDQNEKETENMYVASIEMNRFKIDFFNFFNFEGN